MANDRERDELSKLFLRVRRFFGCWLVLLFALAVAHVASAAVAEVVALVALGRGWDDGQLYSHPLALSPLWALGTVGAGIVLGAPVVLLRRHIVRPNAPFLRAGYIGVAAIPIALGLAIGEAGPGWYVVVAYLQAVLLVAALIYVAIARRFALFDVEEWRGGRR